MNFQDFGALVGAVSVLCAFAYFAAKTAHKYVYEPCRGLFKNVAELLKKIETISDKTETIEKEITTNGGSSLKDAVNRIDATTFYLENKIRFREQAENLATFEMDAGARCTSVSTGLCDLLDYSAGDFMGRDWLKIVVQSERDLVLSGWKTANENQIPFDQIHNLVTGKTGKICLARVEAHPFYNRKKELAGFLGRITKL